MTDSVYSLDQAPEEAIASGAAAIAEGKCVVLPTDTVYGIGVNAFDAAAVQALLEAKERGRDMPPPVLIAEPGMLRAVADEIPEAARDLAKAFWPGALTLVLKAQSKAGMQLGETSGTVAVRVPDHDGARAFLRATGPLAVSSANISGQAPAQTAQEALAQLGERVAVYLDAGEAPGKVASTIVDFASTAQGRILRAGAISLAELQTVAPEVLDLPEPETPALEAGTELSEGSSEDEVAVTDPPSPEAVES